MPSDVSEVFQQEKAAIFFHAPWSGPSVQALARLEGTGESDIRIINLEIENDTVDVLKKEGYPIDGWGEAMVIRSGRVRYFAPLARDPATLDLRLAEFLNEKRA
jgi:hypothetical protein